MYTLGDHEGTLQNEYDDICMKTKANLTRLGGTFGLSKLEEKSFFNTILDSTPYWDYKPTKTIHADSAGVHTSEKILKLNTVVEIHLKCDIFNGSVVNGLRQIKLYSFSLDKPPAYEVFSQPETIHYKKQTNLLGIQKQYN